MKGRAPKDPATGSQSRARRKRIVPEAIAGRATRASSSTMIPTTTRTAPPIATSRPFQTRSPACPLEATRRSGVGSAAPGEATSYPSAGGGKRDGLSLDGERCERLLNLLHRGWRQRSIVERRRGRLPVMHRPPQEAQEGLALGPVRLVAVDEEVGEGGHRVGALAGGVGDRDAVVGRDLHSRGGLGGGLERRLDEVPVAVPERGHGELVLVSVG